MKFIKRHWFLILILCLWNGFLIWKWVVDTTGTNDVGRQWMRLLIPLLMLVSSVILTGIYFFAKFIIIKFLGFSMGHKTTIIKFGNKN